MNGINFCTNNNVLKILHTILKFLDLICMVVPIILIVLLIIDICKNVVSNDDSEQRKNLITAFKRIIYCVLIFFVPVIVNVISHALGDLGVDYASCIENARNYKESAEINSNFNPSPSSSSSTNNSNNKPNNSSSSNNSS